MNLNLEKKLIQRFPKLFVQIKQDNSTIKNCMYFGCAIGDGWYGLLEKVCREISSYCATNHASFPEFAQIKEKFGLLRIYIDNANDDIYRILEDAEKASYFICEDCGATHDVSSYGTWIRTLCSECRKKHNKKRLYRLAWIRKLIIKKFKFMNFLKNSVLRIDCAAQKREKMLKKCLKEIEERG